MLHGKVQASTTGQAGKSVETYLKADDHWTESAAEAYKQVAKPDASQTLAVKQYGNTASEVASAIDTCGYAIIGYWVALGTAFAVLIGSLVAVIAGFVIIVGAAVTVIGGTKDASRKQNDDNFPNGSWPPSGVPAAV